MYYKVLKNNKVIDVLDSLIYLKWDSKHKSMILSGEDEAQAILSSDKNTIWHEVGLYEIPVDGYDTVEAVPIDKFEYEQLRIFNCKSVSELIDSYTLLLIQEGII